MKNSKLIAVALFAAMGFTGLAMANCADDAIAVCNDKHPDPSKNYSAYELCIKAQLGQKCPKNASPGSASNQILAPQQRPTLPTPVARTVGTQQPEQPSRSGR